jgi:vancomycin resistance protein YoaR
MPNCPPSISLAICRTALFGALLFALPPVVQGMDIPESVTLSTDTFVQIMKRDEIESWFALERRAFLSLDRQPEIEDGRALCNNFGLHCEAFVPRALRSRIVLIQDLRTAPEQIRESIRQFAEKTYRDPINARLKVENGVVNIAKEAENGSILEEEPAAITLETALAANHQSELSVSLPVRSVPAKISGSTLASLGVSELVGTATTNFRGSPKNRIYNIHRAIEQFDGIVLEPGQEFSFVEYLGEVDGEHGYLPELVIKNNRTEPEFGGGICQVSTTVFRAALQSGLKITERRNHAYPVQYYRPYGLDATIYIPKPDLKFLNDTPGSLLMIPEIEGTLLTFSFFGTRDGRTATIDGPHILESNPDGSMRTVFTHTVKDASGAVTVNDTFYSNYKSPSLFPHPGEEPVYTVKPSGWSEKQWREYKRVRSNNG